MKYWNFQVKENFLFEETLILFHFTIMLYFSLQGHIDVWFEQVSIESLPEGQNMCWVTVKSSLPITQGAADPHCSLTGIEKNGQVFL